MKETPAQIHGPNFTAGIILWDDKFIEAVPIIHDTKRGKWARDRVTNIADKGWHIERPA